MSAKQLRTKDNFDNDNVVTFEAVYSPYEWKSFKFTYSKLFNDITLYYIDENKNEFIKKTFKHKKMDNREFLYKTTKTLFKTNDIEAFCKNIGDITMKMLSWQIYNNYA